MFARLALSSFGLALTFACAKPADQTAAAPPAVDSAAAKAGAASVWTRWSEAALAGNADGLAGLVADSARLDFRGFPPMIGREAFKTAVTGVFQTNKYTAMSVVPEMTEAISNDLVYETGNITETYTMKGKSMTEYGRYAAALTKGADGQWRVGYLIGFADSTVTAKP